MQKISEKSTLQGIPAKTKSEIKFEAEAECTDADLRRYKEWVELQKKRIERKSFGKDKGYGK